MAVRTPTLIDTVDEVGREYLELVPLFGADVAAAALDDLRAGTPKAEAVEILLRFMKAYGHGGVAKAYLRFRRRNRARRRSKP